MLDKKRIFLITTILLEIFIVFYLLNNLLSKNIVPVIIDIPKELIVFKNISNSSFKYFYENSPNMFDISNTKFGTVIIYSINSDGLRERYNYTKNKPDNTFRIAIFGDSFVYGLYVNISDVFTELLEDDLNLLNCSKKIEVINFGVPGYDIPYMVESFIRKGRYYEPDISIFLIKPDDIDVNNELWLPIYDKYLAEAGKPHPEKDFVKHLNVSNNAFKEYANKYSIYNNITHLQNSIDIPFKRLKENNYKNSKIIIFSILLDDKRNEYLENKSKEYGFMFTSSNKLGSFVELGNFWDKKFASYNTNTFKDVHPNKLGHKFLANFLYVYLISNNLIEC
jgi:hypothetical protein